MEICIDIWYMHDWVYNYKIILIECNIIYRKGEIDMSCAEVLVIIFTGLALIASAAATFIQYREHRLDWRPILSFSDCSSNNIDIYNLESSQIQFKLIFVNVGKCSLKYTVDEYNIYVNNILQPKCITRNDGSIIGVNQNADYLLYYNKNISTDMEVKPKAESETKVTFKISYKGLGKHKIFHLDYELIYDGNASRFNFGRTYAD